MERLTQRDEFGNADIIGVDSAELQLNLGFDEMNIITDALNRLAAYEDIGLLPNIIAGRLALYEKVCDEHYAEVAKLQAEIERLKQMVKSITGGLDEAIETNQYLENELDKAGQEIGQLKDALAVTDKAFKLICKEFEDSELNWFTPGGNSLEFTFRRKAEREVR